MPSPKVVFVARFEVPTESMLRGGPEHKIQHDLTANGVRCHAVFCRMNPLRTNTQHEFRFFRERPRLLEQKVGVPFCRVKGEKRRNSRLKFQPVLYGRNFNCDGGAEARSAGFDIPVSSSPKFHDRGRLLVDRLADGVSSAQKQRCYQDGFCHVHWMSPHVGTICIVKRKNGNMRGP